MTIRDDLRKRDPTSPELPRLNKDIQNCTQKAKMERLCWDLGPEDRYTKLWRTLKELNPRTNSASSTWSISDLKRSNTSLVSTLFNLSVTTFQILAIWKSSLIIPIAKPGRDTSMGTSYRPISLLCPAAKVLEFLMLPTINKYLQPALN